MENLNSPHKRQPEEEEEFVYTKWDNLQAFGFVVALLAFLYYTQFCIGPRKHGKWLNCETMEIHYTSGATKEEAARLCENLKHSKEKGTPEISIQLSKEEDIYVVKFIIKKEMQAEEDIIYSLQAMANDLSKDVFEKELVEVHVCDAGFQTVKVLKSEK